MTEQEKPPEVVPAGTQSFDVVDVRRGMFGVDDGGDTSGFGGLVRTVALAPAASRPYGGWYDEVADAVERAYPQFGDAIESEFETTFRGQLRYLLKPAFEPAIECYLDDLDKVAGPAVLGTARLGAGRRLHWEAGVYFPLDRRSPSTTLRIGLEFEF